MAGAKMSEMEVLEQLKDIMKCCVCNETCKDPKMLPCIHTFCRTCLEEIGCNASKSPGDQMSCPICRKEFTIPEEGYAALQTNFFMEKLIEMAKITSPSEGSDLCEACVEGESESTSTSEVPLVPSNCIKHKRELDLYCSDCKKPLCKHCFSEGHQNHRLQDVGNVVEGFKNEIRDILSGLEVCVSEDFEKKEMLNSKVEEYCKSLERLKLEVRAQIDATIKLVSEHADLIMQDIDQLKVQKRKEVEAEFEDRDVDLTCLESFKVECTKVMTKGSASDICCIIDELKARFEDIKKIHESGIEVKTYFLENLFRCLTWKNL